MRHSRESVFLAALTAAILIAAATWYLTTSRVSSVDTAASDMTTAANSPLTAPEVLEVTSNATSQEEMRDLNSMLDDIMAGEASIVEFIKDYRERAHNGDPDAAYYVSRALYGCGEDMMSFGMTIPALTGSNSVPPVLRTKELEDLRPAVSEYFADKPEFYRNQAERRMDRAIECLALGQAAALFEEGRELSLIATQAEHPLATISMDVIDVEKIGDSDLAQLKEKSREYLRNGKDREIFFYASVVSALSLERDVTFERLAWAIAACEYNSCDTLSRLYRGSCEIMSLEGVGDFCSEDMTDYDYLMMKYPGQFDRARARAMTIVDAIAAEHWAELGL